MTTILRIILFFLLTPTFAIVAQTAGVAQDNFRIVDAGFRAESVILISVDGGSCTYDSSGALLQQRKSIDGKDDLSGYQKLETSGAEMLLFAFSAELVAAKNLPTPTGGCEVEEALTVTMSKARSIGGAVKGARLVRMAGRNVKPLVLQGKAFGSGFASGYSRALSMTLGSSGGNALHAIGQGIQTGLTKAKAAHRLGDLSGLGQFARIQDVSGRAARYQSQITGRMPDVGYVIDGVKFDGFSSAVLLDSKGLGYANFVKNGQFQPWYRGADAFVEQAERQLRVSGGTPIQWHFAEEAAANATRNLFQTRGISGIDIIHTPMQ